MYMWLEGEASKGSQEFGSYLVTCVQQRSDSTNHLVAFSDNAAGQKIKIAVLDVLVTKYILQAV